MWVARALACAMRGRSFAREELSRRPAVRHTGETMLGPRTFLGISLAAHVFVGALVFRRTSRHPGEAADAHPHPEAVFAGDTFEVPVALNDDPLTDEASSP